MHLHVNAGKRSVVVEHAGEADMLRRLVLTADVFITDLPADLLDPLDLSWRWPRTSSIAVRH